MNQPAVGESYQLYQYDSCPFCQHVRRFLDQIGMQIELRDTLRDPAARAELIQGGGQAMVPCLRIERRSPQGTPEVVWMYESRDIIRYLADRSSA